MHFDVPLISKHRLKRFHRWAMLWLRWFAAFLDVATQVAPLSLQAQGIAHSWLDGIERLIADIAIIRVSYRVRPLKLKHLVIARGGRRIPKSRAILGCALRRALRSSDLRRRIAALSQSIDALVDRLIRRLPRGLTRRRATVPSDARLAAVPPCASHAPILCADTS